jgi:hypothetical protein
MLGALGSAMGGGMGRKRWAAVVVALLLLAIGCGAGGPRPAPGAHIVVVLRADGGGRVDFWAGGGLHSDRELRDLGRRVTAALFRGKAIGPTDVEPGTAFTFARTEVPRAYGRGRHPVFDVAGGSVGSVLEAAGYEGYTLRIRLPRVRTSIGSRTRPPGSEYSWKVSPGGPSPAGSIVMHPRLLHWGVEMALLSVAVAGVLTALLQRDARIAVAGCAAGLVAAVTVLVSDAASGDALGTLGHLSGTPLTLVTRLPFVALPLVVLAVIRLVRLLTRPAARSRPG